MLPGPLRLNVRLDNILRPSATVKALLLLAFMMVLLVVVATSLLLLDLRQRELTHAKAEIDNLSRSVAEQTVRTFEGVAMVMRGSKERLSDELGRHLELGSFPVQLLLRARASGLPQVKSLFVVDRNGVVVNSSRSDFPEGLSVKNRSFFSHFSDGAVDLFFVSTPEKARIDNQWTFYISARLHDPAGRFRGVLVAALRIEYLEALFSSLVSDSASRVMLLDNNGVQLAGWPSDKAGFGRTGISSTSLAELRASLDGILGISEAIGGGKRFVTYRLLDEFPVIVGVAIDEQVALVPWRRLAGPIVGGVMLVVGFILLATFIMVRNLLRREALEADLRERDEQLRHMVQSVQDAIVTIDAGKCIVLFNRAAERMFGIAADEVIGQTVDSWLARATRRPQGRELQRYLNETVQAPPGMILLGLAELVGDNQEFPVELSLSTTMVRGQVLITAVFRDLAERRRAERELLATNRQLQDLSASLQEVREEERARIARELHDELGQLLTGMRMEVSWLGGRLPAEPPMLAHKVNSIKGLIDQTIVSVRRISSELRPLVLDDLGFAAAAGWYVDQFSARTGLPVTLELPDDDPRHEDAVATALFRVLQESLTNVARHAQASKVDVRLAQRGAEWVLSIRDDGVGFAQGTARYGGIGLIGMRERVHIFGGSFSVVSAPGEGTLVEVVIPQK